jgi:hypothetical protein
MNLLWGTFSLYFDNDDDDDNNKFSFYDSINGCVITTLIMMIDEEGNDNIYDAISGRGV